MKRRLLGGRWRGFTLVEVMVALVAGLIVGMSVVALSKEVTNTFHEESRVVTAESAIRTAMDRLRGDIERASMMSTGNAAVDTTVKLGVTDTSIYPYQYLRGMAGIRIIPGGSTSTTLTGMVSTETALPASVSPMPDAIEITGNLSSNADYYSVQALQPGVGCGSRLVLSNTDALYRLGDPDGGTSGVALTRFGLQQAFFPNTPPGSTTTSGKFYARVIDRNSAAVPPPQQFVVICDAGVTATGVPYVDLDPTSVLTSGGTGDAGSALQLNLGEGMIVSPVNTVRWRLAVTSSSAYDANLNSSGDSTKYDLIRTYLDASGNEVGALGNANGEIVAEFMIDMAFGLNVDQTPAGSSDAGPQLLNIPFDGSTGSWAGAIGGPETQTVIAPTVPSPQRVRSVNIRLASRAALPDRNVDLAETPPYFYRIPVGDAGRFARVRTMLSEVFLTNQGAMTYP